MYDLHFEFTNPHRKAPGVPALVLDKMYNTINDAKTESASPQDLQI